MGWDNNRLGGGGVGGGCLKMSQVGYTYYYNTCMVAMAYKILHWGSGVLRSMNY